MEESYIYNFFHINSKNYKSQVENAPGKNYKINAIGKQYPSHPLDFLLIPNENSFEEGIVSSCRDYNSQKLMELKTLLSIIKSSYFLKITEDKKINSLTPSAGGLYPIEIYVLTSSNHPNKGTYHYNKTKGDLSYIRDVIDFTLFNTSVNSFLNDVSFLIVMTANMENITSKYGARGYRYSLIEAGHIGQNIYSEVSKKEELGCCAIGGFYDDILHQQLNLPENELPIYIYGIGIKGNAHVV